MRATYKAYLTFVLLPATTFLLGQEIVKFFVMN
jgi:hypothetical protein